MTVTTCGTYVDAQRTLCALEATHTPTVNVGFGDIELPMCEAHNDEYVAASAEGRMQNKIDTRSVVLAKVQQPKAQLQQEEQLQQENTVVSNMITPTSTLPKRGVYTFNSGKTVPITCDDYNEENGVIVWVNPKIKLGVALDMAMRHDLGTQHIKHDTRGSLDRLIKGKLAWIAKENGKAAWEKAQEDGVELSKRDAWEQAKDDVAKQEAGMRAAISYSLEEKIHSVVSNGRLDTGTTRPGQQAKAIVEYGEQFITNEEKNTDAASGVMSFTQQHTDRHWSEGKVYDKPFQERKFKQILNWMGAFFDLKNEGQWNPKSPDHAEKKFHEGWDRVKVLKAAGRISYQHWVILQRDRADLMDWESFYTEDQANGIWTGDPVDDFTTKSLTE